MKKGDAISLADKLSKLCSFQIQRYDPPQARPLKDFGINEEGYCIFCEGHSNYTGILKRCIIAFLILPRLQKTEIGSDAILYEKELIHA